MAKNIQTKNHSATKHVYDTLDANELKSVVRDGLVSMTPAEREEFIKVLDSEMKRVKLSMRAYLVPLGIPARSVEELTPTEVGHLVRYLKLTVPESIRAIERAVAKYPAFAAGAAHNGHRLAA